MNLKILTAIMVGITSYTCFGEENLYSFGGKNVRYEELSPASKQDLFKAQKDYYDQINRIVNSEILESYLNEEAKKTGKEREEVAISLFQIKVSEKEAKAWYEENRQKLGGRDYASIKKDITQFLQQSKFEESRDQFIEELKTKHKFSLFIQKPTALTLDINTQNRPFKGNPSAKVELVEFADYRCQYCKQAAGVLKEIAAEYKDRVKFTFMDYTLSAAGVSAEVAKGALCAWKQDKFWEFHYEAFEQQPKLNLNSPTEIAQKLKLNRKKFASCLKAKETAEMVNQSREEGIRIGVRGTPAIFINGAPVVDGYGKAQLRKALDEALATP
ncbi:MAG: thioredoxin domain-containing protein [Zetaproteobacteria bacterium]|nr:thioredoxin domain-containing protein [Zetaproteobacteria bacterium]